MISDVGFAITKCASVVHVEEFFLQGGVKNQLAFLLLNVDDLGNNPIWIYSFGHNRKGQLLSIAVSY